MKLSKTILIILAISYAAVGYLLITPTSSSIALEMALHMIKLSLIIIIFGLALKEENR